MVIGPHIHRVAWSTGSGAGGGGAELRQCTREQVYMLEKSHSIAGKPLCLVDARRQRVEGQHVCVCDQLAHVLLLQIRSLLQIIVINSQFFTAEVRRLKTLLVCLRSRGVTMTTPHGVKLRAELFVVQAPLFHPKHTNPHTSSTHYRQHMGTAAPAQTSLSSGNPYS